MNQPEVLHLILLNLFISEHITHINRGIWINLKA